MHSKWVFKHFYHLSGKRISLLALIWGIGLLSGAIFCNLAPYDVTEVLSVTVLAKPSTVSLLLVCVLPVLLAAIAISSSVFPIAYLLIFLSAITHGFCGMSVSAAFGASAWIVRPLLFFSSSCSSVLMWWLILCNNSGRHTGRHICFALAISCLVFVFDLFLISPIVGDLIKVL